jgi:hypothetical protein
MLITPCSKHPPIQLVKPILIVVAFGTVWACEIAAIVIVVMN